MRTGMYLTRFIRGLGSALLFGERTVLYKPDGSLVGLREFDRCEDSISSAIRNV